MVFAKLVPEEEPIAPVDTHAETRMVRTSIPAADALIGVHHPVLSHGFVALVDYMGDDKAIVQAARVSYGQGTKSTRSDRALIRYLMRHHHTTPFEMVEFKFLVRLPIYVARQWVRHRTVSLNEISYRYSIAPDEYEVPRPESIRAQSQKNRQGRSTEPMDPKVVEQYRQQVEEICDDAYAKYEGFLGLGVARELARIVLPVGFYTEWYWKINLHNLFHFLKLRLDDHAQEEIREYSQVIARIARTVAPVAFEAFEDFDLGAQSFSRSEQEALAHILSGLEVQEACLKAGLPLAREDGKPMTTGEGVEFLDKLTRLRALGQPR